MPLSWSFSQLIDYNFRQVASVLFRKYPNEYSDHVVSVDVLERSVDPETGVIRTERLIGVQQPTPRWVTALLGSSAESYAREVTFVVPASAGEGGTLPPQILVSSINMSLKNVLTCYERISYTASPAVSLTSHDGSSSGSSRSGEPAQTQTAATTTEMTTIAEITAQGKLRQGGMAAKSLGRKMEKYSMDRYVDNSSIGRRGLDSVLEKYFPERGQEPIPEEAA